MIEIWDETIELGPHPDAKLYTSEGADPRLPRSGQQDAHAMVRLRARAFWADKQHVLLIENVIEPRSLRRLACMDGPDLLARLPADDYPASALVRRVCSHLDSLVVAIRAGFAAEQPQMRCCIQSFAAGDFSCSRVLTVRGPALADGWRYFEERGTRFFFCAEHVTALDGWMTREAPTAPRLGWKDTL